MWGNHLEWRKNFGTDEVLDYEYPEVEEVRKAYAHGYHKVDRQGRPVYIELVGRMDLEYFFQVTNFERYIRYFVREYERTIKERMVACTVSSGSLICQSLCILDLHGVKLTQARKVYNFIKQTSTLTQDNYPEMLGTMLIINAPWLFTGV
mmetsp:Transcript_23398/g.11263  ORF Transcript_23398/g.11263 Transcript_23398/m.11263 type:complete len:150 (+) Transcript_23398:126-575(+)